MQPKACNDQDKEDAVQLPDVTIINAPLKSFFFLHCKENVHFHMLEVVTLKHDM